MNDKIMHKVALIFKSGLPGHVRIGRGEWVTPIQFGVIDDRSRLAR
jgi:hypothetical protein